MTISIYAQLQNHDSAACHQNLQLWSHSQLLWYIGEAGEAEEAEEAEEAGVAGDPEEVGV